MNLNGGILPQIVHCLFCGPINSIVSGVPGVLCLVPGQSSASPHSALGRQKLSRSELYIGANFST